MGAAHVAQVYTHWAHLPDRPFRALAYMALVAKDSTKEPSFWGGRDALALALGLDMERGADVLKLKRAVRVLKDSGAITTTYLGHANQRSEYRIYPEKGVTGRPPKGSLDAPLRGSLDDPLRGSYMTPKGVTGCPKGGHGVTPLGVLGIRGSGEEPISSPTVVLPRASAPVVMNLKFARSILLDIDPAEARALKLQAPLHATSDEARTIWAAEQIQSRREAS